MMPRPVKDFASVCVEAAERVADAEDFVPVRRLVEFFGAELSARPLLYEGMVAAPKEEGGKWLILVDSLNSGFLPDRYDLEKSAHPLPARLRFTIAHELSHVLQLKTGESEWTSRRQTPEELEKRLEREADLLTPLLLIPVSGFEKRCTSGVERLTLKKVLEARKHWAVSREVMISRFNLLGIIDPDGFRFRPALKNIAIGIAEWKEGNNARIVNWPKTFYNFSENIVPSFLHRRSGEPSPNLNETFTSPEFYLNGGGRLEDEAIVLAGTTANPKCEKIRVRLSVERTKPAPGTKFVFLVSGV